MAAIYYGLRIAEILPLEFQQIFTANETHFERDFIANRFSGTTCDTAIFERPNQITDSILPEL